MTRNEISDLGSKWSFDAGRCARTLYEISKIEEPREGGKTHCLENKRSGRKLAIWFDEVMADWTNLESLRKQSKILPHRIDGCYVQGENIYLIEFKADGDWKFLKDNLWAKFHDGFCQLIGRAIISLSQAREHLYYIVVTSARMKYSDVDLCEQQLKKLSQREKAAIYCNILNPSSDLMLRPWKHPEILPKADLLEIAGYSCKAVYTMSVPQFDRYVEDARWTVDN